jgi:nitrate reductase cytochrome c-type subunit
MNRLSLVAPVAGLVFLVGACATSPPAPPPPAPAAAAGAAAEVAPTDWAQETGNPQYLPDTTRYGTAFPGESEVMERGYQGAPPMVPHDITAMTVGREYNTCLACHLTGERDREGRRATPVPDSHFTDLYDQSYEKDRARAIQTYRNARLPSKHGLLGTRYVCTQCHAPQADVPPWKPSTF